jgi:hypothetical protein
VNVLSEEKKQQVLALGRLGWSLRRIERSIHIRRETAATYLKRRAFPSGRRGGGGRGHPKPAIEVSTDSRHEAGPAEETRRPDPVWSASACEPYREFIEAELAKGRNAMAIWQDLVDTYGFSDKYASVKRFVRKVRGSSTPEARVVIATAPRRGSSGRLRHWSDGARPENRPVPSYAVIRADTGYSRKSVRLLVFHSSARIWAELHEQAFRLLGDATRVVVLDNLRDGVLTPDIYDPTLNPLYRDVLQHYGATALPSAGPGSQRQSRIRGRSCEEDAAQRAALRELGRGANLSGPLGNALGRHPHSWSHQAASRGHVR